MAQGERFVTTVLGWMRMWSIAPRVTREHYLLCGVNMTTHLTMWRAPTITF
ncbi:hypothetical protein LINPERPRIM_LOCUS37639, partial [Linum perenne]